MINFDEQDDYYILYKMAAGIAATGVLNDRF